MIDSNAPVDQFKCIDVCIKLISVEVLRKHFDLAGEKSVGHLPSEKFSWQVKVYQIPTMQLDRCPKFFIFVP